MICNNIDEINLPVTKVFSFILGNRKCLYFSTPMTNGLRLVKWRARTKHLEPGTKEYTEQFIQEVLTPNCQEGERIAQQLRERTGEYVIDPSCFDVEGWSQEEYLSFWCSVITRYAKEIRFNEGWAYSNGCTREFLAAKQAGIITANIEGNRISCLEAIQAISSAIIELQEVSIPTRVLEATVKELSNLL
jgi:hypothetical protein